LTQHQLLERIGLAVTVFAARRVHTRTKYLLSLIQMACYCVVVVQRSCALAGFIHRDEQIKGSDHLGDFPQRGPGVEPRLQRGLGLEPRWWSGGKLPGSWRKIMHKYGTSSTETSDNICRKKTFYNISRGGQVPLAQACRRQRPLPCMAPSRLATNKPGHDIILSNQHCFGRPCLLNSALPSQALLSALINSNKTLLNKWTR